MTLKRAELFFIISVLALYCGGQKVSPPKKAVTKNEVLPHQHPGASFTCPEPEAKQSCNSYVEMAKAKDSALPSKTDNRYVCFRRNVDQFFVVAFATPFFLPTWNEKYKKTMVDPSATNEGSGFASTFKDGVEDSRSMPSLFFSGTWRPYDEGMFSATDLNFEKIKTTDEPLSSVYINYSQLSLTYNYQSSTNTDVIYSLTIQRSTGRFVESFQKKSEQTPFFEGTGRCIYQKAE